MVLQIKHSGNTLEVDLDVVRSNVNYFRSKLKRKTKVMVFIESRCYTGVETDIAELLEDMNVDYIAVTSVKEGCLMRSHGIKVPIVVTHVENAMQNLDKMSTEQLEPVVRSLTMLSKVVTFAKETCKTMNIHLEIDTGGKLKGISKSDLGSVIEMLSTCAENLSIRSVFSELSKQVSPQEQGETTMEEVSSFIHTACRLEQELDVKTLKHLVGNNEILSLPAFHYDMVRLYVGLLGVGVDQKHDRRVEEAISFKSTVSQLRSIPRGSMIPGEQNTFASSDMDVAVVKVGYGDGFRRCLGEGVGYVLVNRHLARTVGKICRETTMIDVTGMIVDVDDEVTIFGKMLSLRNVANAAGTIPEEILCGINERVKRVCYTTFDV